MDRREKLIRDLRDRLKDPKRRTDYRLSLSQHFLRTGSVEEIQAARRKAIDRSRMVIEARQRGDPTVGNLRDQLFADYAKMKTPAPRHDPAAVSMQTIEDAERRLGFALPNELISFYQEVANGGFGPGFGLLPVNAIVERYIHLRSYESEPSWPSAVLPITGEDGEQYCVRLPGTEILRFDPERLNDDNSNLLETFTAVAPSLEHWLQGWVDGPTESEVAGFEAMRDKAFAEARARLSERIEAYVIEIRTKSPEERAKLGLSGDDWEEKLRRGLRGRS